MLRLSRSARRLLAVLALALALLAQGAHWAPPLVSSSLKAEGHLVVDVPGEAEDDVYG